ncbi:tetratricopeptide repeat protein [Zooshikella sp. RANM57]|uniref:tetratricopeptide repeat protein n=1 Tax=Zooshikella sp. RANM57 TaxID=3425863 RepID=UPI003D6DBE26
MLLLHKPVKVIITMIFLSLVLQVGQSLAAEKSPPENQEKPSILERPLMERYVLDELKSLRQDLLLLKNDVTRDLASTQLQTADRSLRYTTDTVNNIFFIITAATSILIIAGWSSLRDVKSKVDELVDSRVRLISQGYEKRLAELEKKLRQRTDQIIQAQEEIALTNNIHSLWMRSGLESTPQSKIKIYDQILSLNPEDVEALTYKADAALELEEPQWALSLCNKALEISSEYPYAYYQRACAHATLGLDDQAVDDLTKALELSSTYADEMKEEPSFKSLSENERFLALVSHH